MNKKLVREILAVSLIMAIIASGSVAMTSAKTLSSPHKKVKLGEQANNDKILRTPENVSAFESVMVYANVTENPSKVLLNGTIKIETTSSNLNYSIFHHHFPQILHSRWLGCQTLHM